MSHVYWRYPVETDINDDWRVCYGIIVVAISLVLFGILVSFMPVLRAGIITFSFIFLFIGIGFCITSTHNAPQEANQRSSHHQIQTLNAIPGFVYGSSAGDEGDSFRVCSVCIEKLEEGEIVKQMPSCKHVFHAGCIDMWLCSHVTCPLCRSNVEPLFKDINESSDLALPPV